MWPLNDNKFLPGKSFEIKRIIDILIRAADHGDILRTDILEEIEELNKWIMLNITIPSAKEDIILSYQVRLKLKITWI